MSDILKQKIYKDFFLELPHSKSLLKAWSNKTIQEISLEFVKNTDFAISEKCQEIIKNYISPILGIRTATQVISNLKKSSRILCLHHLGIECMAEQVQIIHFFGLNEILEVENKNKEIGVIPILACTSIPLQSYSYPRGFMPARRLENGQKNHAPLFPSSYQNTMVYSAPRFTKEMLLTSISKWNKNIYLPDEWEIMHQIVNSIIMQPECLELPSLNLQFMHINNKLFKLIYPDHKNLDLIYLDLEEITGKLIQDDLSRENSLLSTIFFNEKARNSLFNSLVNERGCFSKNAIEGKELDRCGNDGSIFFWTKDQNGRRIPLSLRQNPLRLSYKDFSVSFEAKSLITALENKQLIPTLLTSFISLHLEHNLWCYGGLYMSEYLPKMLSAAIDALKLVEYHNTPALPKFNAFATGAFTVQAQIEKKLFPAGSIEIISAQGLKQRLIHEIKNMKFAEVLPLAMTEWSLYFTSKDNQTKDWLKELDYASTKWKGIVL